MILIFLAAAGFTPGGALAAQEVVGPPRIGVTITRYTAGDVRSADLAKVARYVAALAMEQAERTMQVGDTIAFDTVAVYAIDSTGAVIGRMRILDSGLKPSPVLASVGPRRYVAQNVGTAVITLRYPRVAWKERADDPVEIKVLITVREEPAQAVTVLIPQSRVTSER